MTSGDVTGWPVAVIETLDTGVCVHDSGFVRFVNRSVCRTLDLPDSSRHTLVGRPLVELANGSCVPDMHTLLASAVDRSKESWGPVDLVLPRGPSAPRLLRASGRPIAHGSRPASVFLLSDITSRHFAAKELDDARRWLENIFNSLDEAVLVVTPDRQIADVNPAAIRMFGYSLEELRRQSTETIHVDRNHYEEFGRRIGEAFARGEPARFEFEARRKNGEVFPSEHTVTLLRGPDGEQVGIVSVVRDLTERKRAEDARRAWEEQLRETQKLEALGIFAGGIAHDFNNILMGLQGSLDRLRLSITPGGPVMDRVAEIQSATKRAAALVRQVLDYAGLESVRRPVDLNAVVAGLRTLMLATASKKAVLELDLDPNLPRVMGNESQLGQIVMNLVSNASDALGDEPGHITLRTCVCPEPGPAETGPPWVSFEVSDDGCGMSPNILQHLFDPFFSSKSQGRGLGMAVVQGIVRSHHGHVVVRSKDGQGTTIRVELPSTDQAPSTVPPPLLKTASAASPAAGKVLVADDDQLVREVLAALLEAEGYDVVQSADGRSAVELFEREMDAIRFVVLDLTMPGLDGAECLERMRALRPQVPAIIASGYSEKETRGRIGKQHSCVFLEKPFERAELLAAVQRLHSSGSGKSPG